LVRPAAEAVVDFKKFGNILTLAGVAVLVGACIWWFSFYSSIVREIGWVASGKASVSDTISCLYSTSGICTLIATFATATGRAVYEPMLFWFGLAGLLLGLLIRFTAKPSAAA
jgi:hypothetical protein